MLLQSRQIQPSIISADKRKQPSFTASVEFLQKTVKIKDAEDAYIRAFHMFPENLQDAILRQKETLKASFPANFQIVIGEATRNKEIGFDTGRSKDIFSVYVKFREAIVRPSGLLGRLRGKKTKLAGEWQELPLIDYFERHSTYDKNGRHPTKTLTENEDIDIKRAIKNYLKTAQANVCRQQEIDEANMAAEQHKKIIQALGGRSPEEIEAEMTEIEALLRNNGSDEAFAVLQKLHDMGFLRDSREYSNRLSQGTANHVALLPAISTEK